MHHHLNRNKNEECTVINKGENTMNIAVNIEINTNGTNMTSQEYMDMYFELAIKALIKNHFKSCMKYFQQSTSHGSKRAYMYNNLLRRYEDIMLARDIILCAEKRI